VRESLLERMAAVGWGGQVLQILVPPEEIVELKKASAGSPSARSSRASSSSRWSSTTNLAPGQDTRASPASSPVGRTRRRSRRRGPEIIKSHERRGGAEAARAVPHGESVRITDGPFTELHGVVTSQRGARQAARDGQHLRPFDPGRAGLPAVERVYAPPARTTIRKERGDGEEGSGEVKAPAHAGKANPRPRRAGPVPARGSTSWSSARRSRARPRRRGWSSR